MKGTFPVRGIGSKGVSEDIPATELGLEYFNYAENVYTHDMRLKNVPNLENVLSGSHGEVQWFGYRYDEATREPEVIYVGRDLETGVDKIYIIKHENLGNIDGTEKGIDASRTTPAYTNISAEPYARWQGFVSNGMVVLTNGNDVPQILPFGSDTFVNLPNWNADWTCKAIMPFRGVWVALNIIDSGATAGKERQANVLRWSSPMSDFATEPLWWSELDGSNQPTGAGYNPLGETQGEIMFGRTLRDAFLIYKQDSVVRADYTGNPQVPFSFRTVFEDTGAWGVNAVCSVRNEHFVVGFNDVYMTDGFQKRSVISNKVKDRFDKLVFASTAAHDVQVVPNYANDEIFVLIRVKNSNNTLQTHLLSYDYVQDQWFFRTFDAVGAISFAGPGSLAVGDPIKFDKWDDPDNMTWDEGVETSEDQWDNFADVMSVSTLMFTAGEEFFNYGPYRNSTSGQRCLIQKHDMDFNQVAGVYSDQIKRLLRIYPIIDPESRGYIAFRLWGHDRPGQVVDEIDKRWYLFNCETDHKVDCSVSGRYISMEISVLSSLYAGWDNYEFLNNPTKPLREPDNLMSLTGLDLVLAAVQRR